MICGLAAIAILTGFRSLRGAVIAVCLFSGVLIGREDHARRQVEARAFQRVRPDQFVVVEAAIDRDWSAQPHYSVLRVRPFRAAGVDIDAPLSLYVRFAPRAIQDESVVRAEGFLRLDERGRYALSIKSPRLLSYHGRLSRWWPGTWNRLAANRLRPYAVTHPAEIAMIEALVLGRGERLSHATRDQFKRGGTYHLLVFSGLQISLAAGAIALLLRWLGAARASDVSLLAFAITAPLFIGPSASVSRAGIGIALYAVSRLLHRPTSFENLWCVAALIRLATAPSDLTDPAFHLTYAGAGALLFVGKPLARSRMRWVAYAVAAEIAIAPLTLHHFHQYALGGSLLTVIMTPVVFVMLIAGALFIATEFVWLLDAVAALNGLCAILNEAAAPLSGFFAAPPAVSLALGFGGAIASIALLRGRRRTMAIIAALLLPTAAAGLVFHARRTVRDAQITFLDVGQGDAVLIRSGRRAMLVDGGPPNARLPAMLAERGVRRLDLVVLSHAHPDHCGGVIEVLGDLDVGQLWVTPQRFRGDCARNILERAPRIEPLRGDRTWLLDSIRVEVTTPRRRYRRAPENNGSLLVRIIASGRTILLTGDIERDAERDLAAIASRADLLKIAHHGSRSSTSDAFLDAVQPRIGVISCGRKNLFGHPHPAVLAALRDRNTRVFRTDRHGDIRVELRGKVLFVTREIDTQE